MVGSPARGRWFAMHRMGRTRARAGGEMGHMTTEPETFSLSRTTRGASEVVTLAGELDMAHAPTVAETLDALTDDERPVVVDLSELTFIDSSGIHAILRQRPQQG